MFIDSKTAEEQTILTVANAMCTAARTAPKARGLDYLKTAVLTGADISSLAAEMRRMGEAQGEKGKTFIRDAGNVEASSAVVLIGMLNKTHGLNERCCQCGFANCQSCEEAGAICVYTSLDLGIAVGSAVSLAADQRIDNRVMFTIGKAAASLELLGELELIMGIPLSSSGKSIYFDR